MMGRWPALRSRRYAVVYLTVCSFAVGFLLFDTREQSPPELTDWLLLLLVVLPVTYVGERLSGGLLYDALTSIWQLQWLPLRLRWWPMFYYVIMCILFAVTAVVIFEWIARVTLHSAAADKTLV